MTLAQITRSARVTLTGTCLDLAVRVVARRAGLAPEAVRGQLGRQQRVKGTFAAGGVGEQLMLAIYLSRMVFDLSEVALGEILGVHRSVIRRCVEWVEERREDGRVDRMLDELELALEPPPGEIK